MLSLEKVARWGMTATYTYEGRESINPFMKNKMKRLAPAHLLEPSLIRCNEGDADALLISFDLQLPPLCTTRLLKRGKRLEI